MKQYLHRSIGIHTNNIIFVVADVNYSFLRRVKKEKELKRRVFL